MLFTPTALFLIFLCIFVISLIHYQHQNISLLIAIIKYNAGNVQSVQYALERLGASAVLTNDWDTIAAADRVIFPGVGHAGSAMPYLKNLDLHLKIPTLKQPFLGICLGMQLLCQHSEEGDTPCLGIFDTKVKKFENQKGSDFKIPHMGWNAIVPEKIPLFEGIQPKDYVYFVHSYYAEIAVETVAQSHHILNFSAALAKDNFMATQFHPEKSAAIGNRILQNFIQNY
ncbi:MAG: imidazole glycerol phosphate synthase subunit HisH [Bernardetiaceae bacterium]|nr:imidazole glycerol phosphate synthase subunit HisH [Bernardetiaceae bacterium]